MYTTNHTPRYSILLLFSDIQAVSVATGYQISIINITGNLIYIYIYIYIYINSKIALSTNFFLLQIT